MMTPQQWKAICDCVADAMRLHTRPFVTPLGTETETNVRLVGTGSYVHDNIHRILLTCKHVAEVQPMHYRFSGSDCVFAHQGPWTTSNDLDAAFAPVSDPAWIACPHQAQHIPYSRFDLRHAPVDREILFFRGFSGENAHYAFRTHQTNASGYATQEKENSGDDQLFELLWEPENIQTTRETSPQNAQEMKFENPRGFSGSLVWNTRYVALTSQGMTWTPAEAVVTGLLQRWDENTRTLLALRVEHLRRWLPARQSP